jgi:hypothetical protein
MHVIWNNDEILARVALHLQGPSTIHELLPLLWVNRAFRSLTEKKLVAIFRETGVFNEGAKAGQVDGEGFLKCVFLLRDFLSSENDGPFPSQLTGSNKESGFARTSVPSALEVTLAGFSRDNRSLSAPLKSSFPCAPASLSFCTDVLTSFPPRPGPTMTRSPPSAPSNPSPPSKPSAFPYPSTSAPASPSSTEATALLSSSVARQCGSVQRA